MRHREIELASAACRSYAVPTELHPCPVHEGSATYEYITTRDLTVETEAVARPIRRLATRGDNQTTQSCKHSHRVNELDCEAQDWHAKMFDSHLQRIMWIYCSGKAASRGMTEQTGRKCNHHKRLIFGRTEVLRSLRHYLWAQSQERHIFCCLEERCIEETQPSTTYFIKITGSHRYRQIDVKIG